MRFNSLGILSAHLTDRARGSFKIDGGKRGEKRRTTTLPGGMEDGGIDPKIWQDAGLNVGPSPLI